MNIKMLCKIAVISVLIINSLPSKSFAQDGDAIMRGLLGSILQGIEGQQDPDTKNETPPKPTTNNQIGGFLCLADQVTGFYYSGNTRSWQLGKFNTDQSRYLIKPLDNNYTQATYPDAKWVVSQLGDHWKLYCSSDITGTSVLTCQDAVQIFVFDKTAMKFQYHNFGNYLNAGNRRSEVNLL